MENTERRRWNRLAAPTELHGTVNGATAVQVLNLGPGGAMIQHSHRLSPGTGSTFSLRLAGLDLQLRARVMWSQIHSMTRALPSRGQLRYRSGLFFFALPEGAEAHLRRLVNSLTP